MLFTSPCLSPTDQIHHDYTTMRKSTLRRTTLLSLVGMSSSQQGSSSSSTENLILSPSTSVSNLSTSTSAPSALTLISGIQSGGAPQRTASLSLGSVTRSMTTARSSSSTTGSVGAKSTGGAESQYQVHKMGFLGALAGAAGVMLV
jgi:hypothetical protein